MTLRIGEEVIPAVHTHTMTLIPRGGQAREAVVGVVFPAEVRMLGSFAELPSPLHSAKCEPIARGARCTLSPIDRRYPTPYRLLFATTSDVPPTVITISADVEVMTSLEYEESLFQPKDLGWFIQIFGAVVAIYVVGRATIEYVMDARKTRRD